MTAEAQRKSGEPSLPVMRMLRDARINLVWEGTSEILRAGWRAKPPLLISTVASPFYKEHGPTGSPLRSIMRTCLCARAFLSPF